MNNKYEYLEHTGDVKIRGYGNNLGEKFANVGLAVMSIMVEHDKVKPAVEREIKITGKDLNALLYNFVDELLFLMDSEFFLLNKFKTCKIEEKGGENGYALSAIAVGDINQGQYAVEGGVKAATYNEMEITKEYAQVVVDI